MTDQEPGRWAPEDVYANTVAKMPDGAIMTNVVVLVEYMVPGEEDVDDRGPFLAFGRNNRYGAAIWRHIGMLRVLQNDLDYQCLNSDKDDD